VTDQTTGKPELTKPELSSADFYDTLREANIARQKQWDAGDQIDLSYRGNELAGEVGEALEVAVNLLLMSAAAGRASNIMKKLHRKQLGIRGSRATKGQLADELADMIICADLIAASAEIDLKAAVIRKFNLTSAKNGFNVFLDWTPGAKGII
jgi:NTP pyrophosphatase (non-canonical NTP hydrolase)